MNDTPNARPVAPGPSLEDELRKVVDADRAARISGSTLRATSAAYGSEPAPKPKAPLPSGQYIASRIGRIADRLRSVDAVGEGIALTLAGPSPFSQLPTGKQATELPPAETLFVIYERTLDEIDRIIDNIESEQARTRNILGD